MKRDFYLNDPRSGYKLFAQDSQMVYYLDTIFTSTIYYEISQNILLKKSFAPLTLISLYFKLSIPVKYRKMIRSSSKNLLQGQCIEAYAILSF